MYSCDLMHKSTYILVALQRHLRYASTGGINGRILSESNQPAGPVQAIGILDPRIQGLYRTTEPARGRQIIARYGGTTVSRAAAADVANPGGYGQQWHAPVCG